MNLSGTLMNPNAFLVRPKQTIWGFITDYFSFGASVPDHRIYAPERFILGYFKEKRDGGFILSPTGIFYRDSQEILDRYKRDLEGGKLETVKRLSLPEGILETIMQEAKKYVNARKQISNSVETFINS